MLGHKAHPKHHSLRYYLVITTVVVVVLFFLLTINDGNDGLTGSILGVDGVNVDDSSTNQVTDQEFKEDQPSTNINYPFSLIVEKSPSIEQSNVQASSITLNFENQNTKIQVNNQELSLQDLSTVTLTINNYEGELEFDWLGFSINGKAKELVVNGVALSTDSSMDVSLNDLIYSKLQLSDISFSVIDFMESEGNLDLQDKLSYNLEKDDVRIKGFQGTVYLDKGANSTVNFQGNVDSFIIDGGLEINVE